MSSDVEDGEIVVPGQLLHDGTDYAAGDGTFNEGTAVISEVLGAANERGDALQVNPRYNPYVPSTGDLVIGEIERVGPSNWNVDIGCPWSAFMHVNEGVDEYVDHDDDISQWYDIGDLIVGKVTGVTKGMDVKLSMDHENARELDGGRVITIPPSKVPRVIGSKGSMVELIKNATDTMIVIGQNGRVWIDGGNEDLAVRAVRKVAAEAHADGLSATMEDWLQENGGDV